MVPEPSDVRRWQRLGAYAVALRDDDAGTTHLLLTRISAAGHPAGWWALPGGGVDHGEPPAVALEREVYEEAGLRLASFRLVDIHDLHDVSTTPAGVVEDYHGVHVLYAAQVDAPGLPEPHVVEVDGTTDVAAWVPLEDVRDGRPVVAAVEHVLAHLDDYR